MTDRILGRDRWIPWKIWVSSKSIVYLGEEERKISLFSYKKPPLLVRTCQFFIPELKNIFAFLWSDSS